MVSHWSLSDLKSSQVSRILLSILADLTNVVVWIVSTRSLIFTFSSPCASALAIVPKATITIGIIITFMFHTFFNSLARCSYLSFFTLSFNFTLWSARTAKSTIREIIFYLFVWPRLDDPFASQDSRGVCESHSPGQIVRMVKLQFLAQLLVIRIAHPVMRSLIFFLC